MALINREESCIAALKLAIALAGNIFPESDVTFVLGKSSATSFGIFFNPAVEPWNLC
ncbi:MAG: hypothetical protein V3U65_12460 [Granulosicoccaceae bacterium]